jgi:hypothetical protein
MSKEGLGNKNRRKVTRPVSQKSVKVLREQIMSPEEFINQLCEAGYIKTGDSLKWSLVRQISLEIIEKRARLGAGARKIICNICDARALGKEITSIKILDDEEPLPTQEPKVE